ncbi:MAG: hypothetical protein IJW63_05480 [Lachnospiraceae bacterium]|nr:hypothetical protein [Lachnospiraceae bacterium]
MAEHIYEKADLVSRFDSILGLTLEQIDDRDYFEHIQAYALQKGVAGSLIEQCVLRYEPDSKQEADLVVLDGNKVLKTELKTTGMTLTKGPDAHYVAKEPMSITAVGIYDIANQNFETSHFWEKLQHMLIVYYHYLADYPVEAYEYRHFPVKGYEFHEFDEQEIFALRQDWENVKNLLADIVNNHPGPKTKEWKIEVKEEYIARHGVLRKVLNYVDLAPKFPPRFRLKKPIVSSMIAKHFGFELEQLPGRYATLSDIDQKCHELSIQHRGKTVGELSIELGFPVVSKHGIDRKGIGETVVISMFGGTSKKLNQIELFERFGLIAKTIVVTSKGRRTEDMKLFHVDFEELVQTEVVEEGEVRPFCFEDSALYSFFSDYEFLCVLFQEPEDQKSNALSANRFIGFKRLSFSDEFIYGPVKTLWHDLRDKVMNGKLKDVIRYDSDGAPKRVGSGDISSAPNFMKSKENEVFLRGSGTDSSLINKTECVNGIRMLPQYVWIKGSAIVDELNRLESI